MTKIKELILKKIKIFSQKILNISVTFSIFPFNERIRNLFSWVSNLKIKKDYI